MGYDVPFSDKAKATIVKMQLKEPKNLFDPKHRAKLAWVLVDLILFDFELDILLNCISEHRKLKPGRECTIMDAWKARKNTSGGVQCALDYLHNNLSSNTAVKSSTVVSSTSRMHGNREGMHPSIPANNVPVPPKSVTENKPLDLSALPPPDHGEGDEFGSVTQHINPSSYNDDDDIQLIKDSTLLGYRNPPESKSQVKPTIQPMADPTGYPGGYRPPDWLPPITSLPSDPAVVPPNRDDKFDNTHVQFSESQHQPVDPRGLWDKSGYRQPNMAPAAVLHDPPKAGGLHSLPSVTVSTSGNANQFGSSPRVYKRQASIPNDTSLSGGSERMAGISTGTVTNSSQLAVSDNNAVLTVAVPITDQPTPEASQAPPDSKYGKTNLNVLKNRLQHKKEVTQTVVQTGAAGPRSQTTSNYVNAEMPYQGVSDGTNKPVAGRTDLTSLRSKLEKTKEEREKTVTAGNVNKKANEDYYNMSELSQYIPENPVMINNPSNKKPMAGPRTVTPANHANNDTRSALSASSSKRTYQLWQCAHCQTINKAHHTACEHCKLPRGKMADRSYLCNFCQMMIFVPVRRVDYKETCCPRCKHVYESAL